MLMAKRRGVFRPPGKQFSCSLNVMVVNLGYQML